MRYISVLSKMHPEKKTTVALDYSLVSIMMPTVLVGSFLGVWFNIMMPDFVIQMLLTMLLFFLTFKVTLNGIQLYKKEIKDIRDA
jgi:uncharacterized membrane protein YfcA